MEKKIRLNENDLEMLVKKIIKETEDHENGGNRYMFFSNLQQIKRQCEYLLEFDENQIEGILENGHDWAQDHIAEAYLRENSDRIIDIDEFGFTELLPLNEAKGKGACANRGLSKPWSTPDGPKKRSVCVKNASGNVVKVNFGDPNMRIKKSNPARRKSFRARHKCSNPGPRWRARYWSCKFW
jgi:hypothetical protein